MAGEVARSDIEQYFERYGWSCEVVDDETVRTGFRGSNGAFNALVRITAHWVVFTINPFVRAPQQGWGRAALTALAATNQAIHMAKVGIDQDDDAFLTVELPAESFSYQLFEEAMGALTHAADGFLLTLLQARAIDERNA